MDARDWPALGKPGGRRPAAFSKLVVAQSPGGERLLHAAGAESGPEPPVFGLRGEGAPKSCTETGYPYSES